MSSVRRPVPFQLGSAPVNATLHVVYLGLFPTTLGFTTWAYALARTTSGKMGATICAVPTLVIIMSWLILGQGAQMVPATLAAVRQVAGQLTVRESMIFLDGRS